MDKTGSYSQYQEWNRMHLILIDVSLTILQINTLGEIQTQPEITTLCKK